MKFYFCETCGKRITDRQILEGLGRDKKLKGIYCRSCAVGVTTLEFDALVEPDVRKPVRIGSSPKIIPADSKPVKHASRTHLAPAKSSAVQEKPAWRANSPAQPGHKSIAAPIAVAGTVILAGALFLGSGSQAGKTPPKEVAAAAQPREVVQTLPTPVPTSSTAVPSLPAPVPTQPLRADMIMKGLVLWLNADSGVTVQNGKVSAWQDLSGHGVHALQPNVAVRPTLIANALHGASAIHFDGISSYLEIRQIPDSLKTFTLLFTLRPLALKNYNQSLGPGWGHFKFHSTLEGSIYVGPTETSRIKPQDGPKAGTLVKDVWSQFALVYEQNTATLYQNGKELASKKLEPITLNNFYIGMATVSTLNGDMSEFCLYDRALSESELQALEKMMMHE